MTEHGIVYTADANTTTTTTITSTLGFCLTNILSVDIICYC